MPSSDQDPVDQALRAWEPEIDSDPVLTRHVLNRIAGEDERQWRPPIRRSNRSLSLLWIPAAAAVFIGLFALLRNDPMGVESERASVEHYRLAIDPVARLNHTMRAARPPVEEPSLVQMLHWIQARFELSEAQFVSLAQIEAQYRPDFDRLYRELVVSEAQFGAFESLRLETDRIDFVALYEVIQQRHRTEQAAVEVSAGFVRALLEILDPAQQAHYLALLGKPTQETDA